MNPRQLRFVLIGWLLAGCGAQGFGQPSGSDNCRRIEAGLDALPAIDTHDHLFPFDRLPGLMETDRGRGMALYGLWRNSDYPKVGTITARKPGETFEDWWPRARHDFDNSRATGFYRYQLPAFRISTGSTSTGSPTPRRQPSTRGSSTTTGTRNGSARSSPSGPTPS